MEKKTIYIIFAVGLVLLFLIEPFAIGMINSAGKGGNGSGTGTNFTSVEAFTGTAVANITIVRYEPYLIVSGNNSDAATVNERLIGQGKVAYATWNAGTLVVSLKSSKDVPAAAAEFESGNASVLATAYLTTSPKVMVTNSTGSKVEAEGNSISMQMRPLYDEGSTHEAQFAARVEGGQMTGMGQITILPSVIKGALVEAKISSPPQETYSVAVAWKGRIEAKQLSASAGAAYKEKSYVYVANTSKEALEIAVAGKPYVTGAQPGIISIQNNYTDSETIGRDLLEKGFTAVFPDSVATFSNVSNVSSPNALVASLKASNISATVSADWSAKIRLPSEIVKDGKAYFGMPGGIELAIEGTGVLRQNATAMNVSIDFEAAGSKITRITAVNPA